MKQEAYLKSWTSFLVSILLAVFLGGAFQAFFSKTFFQNKVISYWEEKGMFFHLSSESTELILSEKLWPSLALQINNVKLTSVKKCSFFDTITIEKLRVSLLRKVLRAENLVITPSDCVPKLKALKDKKVLEKIAYSLEQQWPWIVKAFKGLFDVFYVNRWSYNDVVKGNQALITPLIKDLALDLKGDFVFYENTWKAHLKLKRGLIQWIWESKFKESVITTEGSINYPQYNLISKAKFSYVPISKVLEWMSVFSSDFRSFYAPLLWLSCEINLKGSLVNPETMAMNVYKCGLSGEDNKLSIQDIIIFPFSEKYFQPFEVDVSHLNFDKISQFDLVKKKFSLEGIKQKGYLKGKLQVFSVKNIRFQGELVDLKLNVLKNPIKKIEGSFFIKERQYEFFVNDVKWQDDEETQFSGQVSLKGDVKKNEAFLRSDISFFEIPKGLKEDFDIEAGYFSLKFQGLWENRGLKAFKGLLKASFFEKKPYRFKDMSLKFERNKQDGSLKGKVGVSFLEVSSESEFYKNFKKLIASKITLTDSEPLFFERLSFVLSQKKSKSLEWKKGRFQWTRKKAIFRTEGVFKDRKLSGRLLVVFPPSPISFSWKVKGEPLVPIFHQ